MDKKEENKKIIISAVIASVLIIVFVIAAVIVSTKRENGTLKETPTKVKSSLVNTNTSTNTNTENEEPVTNQTTTNEENNITESNNQTTTNDITKSTSYSCPSGYTLSGTSCTKTETINATASKSCPSESEDLDGDYCYAYVSPAGATCKSGYVYYVVTDLCQNPNDENDAYAPTSYTDCSYNNGQAPYFHNGGCNIRENATTTYSCPNGYSLSGSTCVKQDVVNATKN